MDNKWGDISRIIGQVVIVAFLQAYFSKNITISSRIRRGMLLATIFLIFLNIAGTIRNVYTLYKFNDLASQLWLAFDIYELIYSIFVYLLFLYRGKLTQTQQVLISLIGLTIAGGNGFNFVINSAYAARQGFAVTTFWYLNTAQGMLVPLALSIILTFSTAYAYIIAKRLI